MKIRCSCFVCGRENVKLWRPYMGIEPLICATCAEERQSPREYQEVIWEKNNDGINIGTPTDNMLPLAKWTVDENGNIPSHFGPVAEGEQPLMTDQLIVNLKDISDSYQSGSTSLIPAVFDEEGNCWGYTSVPEDYCKQWSQLPTR